MEIFQIALLAAILLLGSHNAKKIKEISNKIK